MINPDYCISTIGYCELWLDNTTNYYYIKLFGRRIGGYDTTLKACKAIGKLNKVLGDINA